MIAITEKHCPDCKETKPLTDFCNDKSTKDQRRWNCRVCAGKRRRDEYKNTPGLRATRTQRWRARNMVNYLASTRRYRIKLKTTLAEGYGGKCTCCGETELVFLSLEHLNGDGKQHLRSMGMSTYSMYRDVIRRKFPPEYTILCMNCNYAKRSGPCPHTEKEAMTEQTKEQQEIERLREALRLILKEAEFVGDAKQPFSTWVAENCRAALNDAPSTSAGGG